MDQIKSTASSDPAWTAFHEAVHVAEGWGWTESEVLQAVQGCYDEEWIEYEHTRTDDASSTWRSKMRATLAFLILSGFAFENPPEADAQGVRQEDAVGAVSAAIAHVRTNYIPKKLKLHVLATDRVRSETAGLLPSRAVGLGESVAAATGLPAVRLDDVLQCRNDQRGNRVCDLSGADAVITARLTAVDDTTAVVMVGVSQGTAGTDVKLLMHLVRNKWEVHKVEYVVFSG